MNPEVIKEAIEKLGNHAHLKHICSDMCPMLKKICSELYPQAKLSVAKFHVIKQVIDALQAVRIQAKNQLKNQETRNEITSHGWSKLELLEKDRCLIMKQSYQWTDEKRQINKLLFQHFPSLEKAY
ncbi:MAG: transposase [Cytophagales bacterium]